MSMFEDVARMNEAFGNPQGNPLSPDWERLKNQAKNIGDEFRELMDDGIGAKDITEVRDAICDILVFTLGLGHMAGLPVEEDMRAVYESNMSKFCKNQEELDATILKYLSLGVETYSEGEYPTKRVKSTKEQTDKNGKADYRKGKMLKGVGYQEPAFRPLQQRHVRYIDVGHMGPFEAEQVIREHLAFVPPLETLHG